jgi:hypothetical protein
MEDFQQIAALPCFGFWLSKSAKTAKNLAAEFVGGPPILDAEEGPQGGPKHHDRWRAITPDNGGDAVNPDP